MTIDVKKLAEQACNDADSQQFRRDRDFDWPALSRFAALVIEECARVCDEQHDKARTSTGAFRADACADAIRALSPEASSESDPEAVHKRFPWGTRDEPKE